MIKSYFRVILYSVFVLLILLLIYYKGLFLVSQIFGNFCDKVPHQEKILNVVSCSTEEVKVNNGSGIYIVIAYGEGMDCPSGCIYSTFKGFFYNGKRYDLQSSDGTHVGAFRPSNQSTMSQLFRSKYYDYGCFDSNERLPEPTKRYLILKDNKFDTVLEYDNVSTEKESIRGIGNINSFGNYCILNGKAVIKNDNILTTNDSFSERRIYDIDISNLQVQKQKISGYEPYTDDELISQCGSGTITNACIKKVAIERNNPKLCKKLDMKYENILAFINTQAELDHISGLYFNCLSSISYAYSRPDVCEEYEGYTKEKCIDILLPPEDFPSYQEWHQNRVKNKIKK